METAFPHFSSVDGGHLGQKTAAENCTSAKFTRKDVIDIQSFFNQYNAQPSEDAKIKLKRLQGGFYLSG